MMPEINETETPEPVLLQPVVMRRRFVALMGEPGDNVYQKEWDALYAIWASAWNQSRRLALLDAASEVAGILHQQQPKSYERLQRMAMSIKV